MPAHSHSMQPVQKVTAPQKGRQATHEKERKRGRSEEKNEKTAMRELGRCRELKVHILHALFAPLVHEEGDSGAGEGAGDGGEVASEEECNAFCPVPIPCNGNDGSLLLRDTPPNKKCIADAGACACVQSVSGAEGSASGIGNHQSKHGSPTHVFRRVSR